MVSKVRCISVPPPPVDRWAKRAPAAATTLPNTMTVQVENRTRRAMAQWLRVARYSAMKRTAATFNPACIRTVRTFSQDRE